jgi:hypothetical protein
MVDTPGFDDSFKNDAVILQLLVDRLNEAYQNGIKLTGVIHLHRIKDPRVGGQSVREMRMFRKLCGDDNLKSVALTTTRWAEVDLAQAEQREADLKSYEEFWKPLIDKGAEVFRHDKGRESATKIIQHLVDIQRPMVPEITVDMVDHGKKLADTAAGQEVVSQVERVKKYYEGELEKLRQMIKEMMESRQGYDHEELEDLREEVAAYEENMKQQDEIFEKMQVDSEKLRKEMDAQYAAETELLLQQIRNNEELLRQEQQQLHLLREEGHRRDLELQAATLQNRYLKNILQQPLCCVM